MCRGAESCEVRAHLDLLLHERIRALCLPLHDSTTQRTASSYVYQSFSFLCFRPFLSLSLSSLFSILFFSFPFYRCFYVFSFSQPHRSHECIGICIRRHKRILHQLYRRENNAWYFVKKSYPFLWCYIKEMRYIFTEFLTICKYLKLL